MRKRNTYQFIPEILAIREDNSDIDRLRSEGGPSSTDILSIYLEGGPRYALNRKIYIIEPPVAFLVSKGTHDNDLQEGKVKGIYIIFNGHGLLRKKRNSDTEIQVNLGDLTLTVPLLKHISPGTAGRILSILNDARSVTGVGLVSRLRRISLLYEAIAEYCYTPGRRDDSAVHREAMRLRELIQAWAFEQTSLERIYQELDLSSAHAETLFRRAFGITPVTYRTQLRLRQARELLVSTQMNVSEVAYEVGYTDPLYFSRVFRKTYGLSPSCLISNYETARKKQGYFY